MSNTPPSGRPAGVVPSTRVFHVTVSDRAPDGRPKTFTMLVPASTSIEQATASLNDRFGAGRVVSVI